MQAILRGRLMTPSPPPRGLPRGRLCHSVRRRHAVRRLIGTGSAFHIRWTRNGLPGTPRLQRIMSPFPISSELVAPSESTAVQPEQALHVGPAGSSSTDPEDPEAFVLLLAEMSALVAAEAMPADLAAAESELSDVAGSTESLDLPTSLTAVENMAHSASDAAVLPDEVNAAPTKSTSDAAATVVPSDALAGDGPDAQVPLENPSAQRHQTPNAAANPQRQDQGTPATQSELPAGQTVDDTSQDPRSLSIRESSAGVSAPENSLEQTNRSSGDSTSASPPPPADLVPEPASAEQTGDSLPDAPSPQTMSETTLSSSPVPAASGTEGPAFRIPSVETVSAVDIGEQLAAAIRQHSQTESPDGSIRFQTLLNPPDLGRVWIELRQTSEGMSAVVAFQDPQVQQLVTSQLSAIENAIGGHEIGLTDFSLATDQQRQSGNRDQADGPESGRESHSGVQPAKTVRSTTGQSNGGLSVFA